MIDWQSSLRRGFVRSRGKRFFVAAIIVAALAGCSLGPEYKRPGLQVPDDWKTPPADSAMTTWPQAGWWHGFGSPELDRYIEQARRANYDLAAAMARVREADAQVTIAGAALLPTIGGEVTAVKERTQATSSQYVNFRQVSPQLTASYMLDFWGRNRAAKEVAEAAATASRYDQATVELTIVTSVASSYFQSVELRDRLAVAEGNYQSASGILKALQRQRDIGIATALDVAQQETTVATLAAVIPPLRQQLRQSLDALAILIARPPEELEASTATLTAFASPVVKPGLTSELLARRPDIAEAEANLISANANIKVARASFFPSITLTAAGGYASSSLSQLIRSSSSVYSFAAGLAQPIFDGGVLKGQYALAQARYDELAANYRKAVVTAFGNVEDALIGVQQTTEQVRRQQVAFDTAQRAHKIAQAQLRSGTINILTVLNTETAMFTAQDALIQARFSNMQAMVNLYSALGGGWQQEQGT
jgi:NodT family efflux transporter outer membrane factor (OMF) lipoprotein